MKRFFFVICCLIIASCHEYEIIEKPDTAVVHEPVVVTATIGQKQTKVVQEEIMDGEGNPLKIKIDWAEAEESFVVIAPDGETSIFTQTADLEDSPEIFSGVLPGQTSRSGETTYNAFYPASKYPALKDNRETLFNEQDGTLNSDMCMMSCTSDGSTFEFEHLTSIIRPVFMIEETKLTNVTSVRIWSHQIKTAEWARTASEYVDVSATCTARKDIYLYISTYVGEDDLIRSFNVEVTANGKFYIGQLNVPEGKSLKPGKFYNPTIELEESKIYTRKTTQEVPAVGKGTVDSPYEISDVGHLAWMANGNNLGGYYLLKSNFHIHTDVVWSFASIIPFTGTIDGNGHTISGTLKANEDAVFMGFVGYNAGTIQNLKINADVIGSGAVTDLLGNEMPYVGGTGAVAGINMEGGKVINCETSNTTCVSIESADNGGGVSAGGLVGLNAGVLQGSKNRATVQAASGLSGALAGGITGGSLGNIDSCENFGQIIGGISTNGASPQIIGGITGLNYNGTITNSINKASAEIYGGDTRDENAAGEKSYTGGIVGYQLGGIVSQCSNIAKITGCVSADCSYIGGIVGLSQGCIVDLSQYVGCSISGCTNDGHIIGNGDREYSFENDDNGSDNSYVGDMFVGGIVGYNFSEESTIAGCNNTGDITGGYSVHSNCTAGIAGVHRGGTALLYGCSNTGEITAGRSYQNKGEGNAHWFMGNIVAFNLGKVCGECCNIDDYVNKTLQNDNEHVCEECEDYKGSKGYIINCESHSHQ